MDSGVSPWDDTSCKLFCSEFICTGGFCFYHPRVCIQKFHSTLGLNFIWVLLKHSKMHCALKEIVLVNSTENNVYLTMYILNTHCPMHHIRCTQLERAFLKSAYPPGWFRIRTTPSKFIFKILADSFQIVWECCNNVQLHRTIMFNPALCIWTLDQSEGNENFVNFKQLIFWEYVYINLVGVFL